MEKLLTVKEVSELTRLSISALWRLRIAGLGAKYIKRGNGGKNNKVLYRASDVEDWLKANEIKTVLGGQHV
ncbi:MAG: helix-turn-helix domain-containing protein [Campylobacteraceae bacterium]|jgi:predicted DNA-binding transcriptional regulator AlpA|nr:helix-turn-helix domain-containing protein [Campylobacteraceae bacterium]